MKTAFCLAVLDAHIAGRLTDDQANAWFKLLGVNLTVGVEVEWIAA